MPAIAVGWLLVSPITYMLNLNPIVLGTVVAVAVVAVSFRLEFRFQSWPCPYCHQPFFRTWWGYYAFSDRCVHCGLAKYAPCDPAGQQWEKSIGGVGNE